MNLKAGNGTLYDTPLPYVHSRLRDVYSIYDSSTPVGEGISTTRAVDRQETHFPSRSPMIGCHFSHVCHCIFLRVTKLGSTSWWFCSRTLLCIPILIRVYPFATTLHFPCHRRGLAGFFFCGGLGPLKLSAVGTLIATPIKICVLALYLGDILPVIFPDPSFTQKFIPLTDCIGLD